MGEWGKEKGEERRTQSMDEKTPSTHTHDMRGNDSEFLIIWFFFLCFWILSPVGADRIVFEWMGWVVFKGSVGSLFVVSFQSWERSSIYVGRTFSLSRFLFLLLFPIDWLIDSYSYILIPFPPSLFFPPYFARCFLPTSTYLWWFNMITNIPPPAINEVSRYWSTN